MRDRIRNILLLLLVFGLAAAFEETPKEEEKVEEQGSDGPGDIPLVDTESQEQEDEGEGDDPRSESPEDDGETSEGDNKEAAETESVGKQQTRGASSLLFSIFVFTTLLQGST